MDGGVNGKNADSTLVGRLTDDALVLDLPEAVLSLLPLRPCEEVGLSGVKLERCSLRSWGGA